MRILHKNWYVLKDMNNINIPVLVENSHLTDVEGHA
jgi:hypothetical protein